MGCRWMVDGEWWEIRGQYELDKLDGGEQTMIKRWK